jgi:hypothetical protein
MGDGGGHGLVNVARQRWALLAACMESDAGWRRVFGCGFNAWVMVDDGLMGRQRVAMESI